MFHPFADWIAATPLSRTLQNTSWVVPTSQSIHIVAISVVFASATLINLRLLGVGAQRGVAALANLLVPWIWVALVVSLLTGTVQTITEPVRQFVAPVFWAKMLMICVVALLTAWFVRTLRNNVARWDAAATRPASAKLFAICSSLLWVAIIVCGRFIAYTYTSHE
jgi:type III secretory pathway component EscS